MKDARGGCRNCGGSIYQSGGKGETMRAAREKEGGREGWSTGEMLSWVLGVPLPRLGRSEPPCPRNWGQAQQDSVGHVQEHRNQPRGDGGRDRDVARLPKCSLQGGFALGLGVTPCAVSAVTGNWECLGFVGSCWCEVFDVF